ncbi:MAG: alpha-glucan family phosphorylase [Deltaproteobacteria bacterium]|nr:alpha-glucan family phosphorylase [Deltaproteobacteria bacterium]
MPYLLPEVPEGLERLPEVALDLLIGTRPGVGGGWRALDPELWQATHNPWLMLQVASRTALAEVAADPVRMQRIQAAMRAYEAELEAPGWMQTAHAGDELGTVAYLSMEFGLSEALPIYSGGLGNVAGDQLKSASDLGVPVIGVGLLYQQGYFRQVLDADGGQQEFYPYNDPAQLPVVPVRDANGEWVRIDIGYGGRRFWLRAWEARVGRVRLLLLDSNDPVNPPADRGVTSELYGGDGRRRLEQEIVLGIGGWRLLRRLDIDPQVCHLNEGHAAFAVLERARFFMQDAGTDFETALTVTRVGNLFTTHTPVAAGFDRYDPALVARCLGHYARDRLGIGIDRLLALGRENAGDPSEPLNMALLAIRGSGAVNGVSRLHGAVSRSLFRSLFPRWPLAEVPIGHVTNGVHQRSWVSTAAEAVWVESCCSDVFERCTGEDESALETISDERLWQMRAENRRELVEFVRRRFARQIAQQDIAAEKRPDVSVLFDPNTLTLGFARRFATYKRPNLLLSDPSRLVRLLANPDRPVQLVIAGKAHPADAPGKALVREWVRFTQRSDVRGRCIFLADYDMALAEHLVQGVDVWINNPRRPFEASGTSGMKVLVNGGLNLSELDGWWAEAYAPDVGWAIGDGAEHGEDPAWDAAEARTLYAILEEQVVPAFYDRDAAGIPRRWIALQRRSMTHLTPRFSSQRTVREYTERYYLPAARAYRARAAAKGAAGAKIRAFRERLTHLWPSLRLGPVSAATNGSAHRFRVEVHLGELAPDDVLVEAFADAKGGGCERHALRRVDAVTGSVNAFFYEAEVKSDRPLREFTLRVIPSNPGLLVPLEAPQILWQR